MLMHSSTTFRLSLSLPDKHEVGLSNMLVSVGAEKQVAPAALFDDFCEARLVDWQVVAVPGFDPGLVNVDDYNFDLGALERNLRHCWPADIPSSNASNLHVDLQEDDIKSRRI